MVLKNKIQSKFTIISNVILSDPELGLFDRGLLSTLYSLPDGWNLSIRGLSSIVKDGQSSISAGLNRLIKAGYIHRYRARNEEGQLGETVYELIIPEDAETRVDRTFHPRLENPDMDYPNMENPSQYNTKKNKNKDDDDTRAYKKGTSIIESAPAAETLEDSCDPLVNQVMEILNNPNPAPYPKTQAEIIAARIRRQQEEGCKIANARRYVKACIDNYVTPVRRPDRQRKPPASQKKNGFINYTQRHYDFEKLEKELLGGGGG